MTLLPQFQCLQGPVLRPCLPHRATHHVALSPAGWVAVTSPKATGHSTRWWTVTRVRRWPPFPARSRLRTEQEPYLLLLQRKEKIAVTAVTCELRASGRKRPHQQTHVQGAACDRPWCVPGRPCDPAAGKRGDYRGRTRMNCDGEWGRRPFHQVPSREGPNVRCSIQFAVQLGGLALPRGLVLHEGDVVAIGDLVVVECLFESVVDVAR